MTKEEILAMEAGDNLDVEVWDEIFNQEGYILKYSTDISAAWQVVEKLGGGTDIVQIAVVYQLHFGEWTYRVTISFQDIDKKSITVLSKTAPEAICKAALLAKLEIRE